MADERDVERLARLLLDCDPDTADFIGLGLEQYIEFARRLLETGEVQMLSAAAAREGLSRLNDVSELGFETGRIATLRGVREKVEEERKSQIKSRKNVDYTEEMMGWRGSDVCNRIIAALDELERPAEVTRTTPIEGQNREVDAHVNAAASAGSGRDDEMSLARLCSVYLASRIDHVGFRSMFGYDDKNLCERVTDAYNDLCAALAQPERKDGDP